jgi:hypothetical protein
MMKTRRKSLEQNIEECAEQSMRKHIAGLEKAALEAVHRGVRRALGTTAAATPSKPRGRKKGLRKAAASKRARRTPAELAALEEQLHAAICAQPGEGMAAYAAAVKSTSEKLNHPMRSLRSAKRIRSVGRKGRARYFPTGD